MAILDYIKKKARGISDFLTENPTPIAYAQKKATAFMQPVPNQVRVRDVVREIPNTIINKPIELANKVGNYELEVATGNRNIFPQAQYTPTFREAPRMNTLKGAYNLGAGFVNSIGTEGIIKPVNDLVQGIADTAYNNPLKFKSGAFRLGQGIMKGRTLQEHLANAGQAVMPIVDAMGTGKIYNSLQQGFKQALKAGDKELAKALLKKMAKESSKVGGRLGLAGGLASGAQSGRENTLGGTALEMGKQGLMGYGLGRGLGYAMPYIGDQGGKFVNDIKTRSNNPESLLGKASVEMKNKGGLSIEDVSGEINPSNFKSAVPTAEDFNIKKNWKEEPSEFSTSPAPSKTISDFTTNPPVEPLGGANLKPQWLLGAGEERLALPAGPFTARTNNEAKRLFNKYGKAPELKIEKKSGRPIYVAETGDASFSRNKAEKAGIGANLEGEFKDISTVNKSFQDVYRNFRKFFGTKSEEYADKYLRPFEKSKDTMYKNLDSHADELERDIVNGLGIKRGSKESVAVQELGEGLRDRASIVKDFGEEKAKNIEQANAWFRNRYDKLLDEVNSVREYVYPNNPDKQIAKRNDYYRHFRELQDGFGGLMNIFETPAGIDNSLAGISNTTKPQSKWASFMQKRIGTKTDMDAVGGYLNYIGAAEYAKNVDPHINGIRKLAETIGEVGNKTGKDYNKFIQFLSRWADDLSGKTNPLDRGFQEVIDRKLFKVVDWANSRVKSNTILGNASSSLAQAAALPAGIVSAGEKNMVKGFGRLLKGDATIQQSSFIRERYFKSLDRFDTGILNNTKKFATWMVTVLDEFGTKTIWNAHYEKALQQGAKNPIQYADDMTRNIVAGRGVGEMPMIQRSRVMQLAAPFQLEVGNYWPLMKEIGGEGAGKLAKLFLYTYIFNKGVKEIRGSDVLFDPVNAIVEGYQQSKEEDTLGGKARAFGGRMAGEVLSNIPFGQSVAGMYPEYGKKNIMETGVDLPTREKFFGKGDPTRFGGGLVLTKGIQDPLYKLIPSFGGAQIKKTIDGIKSYIQGFKETTGGKVQFPIEKNIRNFIQGGLFGTSATKEGQEYYKNETEPLGDVQSEKFKMSKDKKSFYNSEMDNRAADKEKEKIKEKQNSGKTVANGEIGEGMQRLKNGKIYVPSIDKEFADEKKAKQAIAIDSFLNSDEKMMNLDGRLYYKDDSAASGYRSKSIADNTELTTKAEMALYKQRKDVKAWAISAEKLYANYEKTLQDEKLPELDKLRVMKEMELLRSQIKKYASYGGVTKGKKLKNYNNPINSVARVLDQANIKGRSLSSFGAGKSIARTNLASFTRPNIRRKRKTI